MSSRPLDLSVVIVNHNSTSYLVPCIASVDCAAGSLAYETIVVDNASDQSPFQALTSKTPHVKQILLQSNLGFSAANNHGIQIASGRYLLFLNPDTVVAEDALRTMVRFMDSHLDVGASTCFVKLPNGSLDDAAHRGFPTPWNALCHFSGLSKLFPRARLFSGYSLGWKDISVTHDIDALAGCFMLVRREAGNAAGWWDEDYFFYGEDLEFCYALKQLGWRISFVPEVSVLHYKGISSGIKKISRHLSRSDRLTRRASLHHRFDAMRIFYQKHYAERYPRPLTWLVLRGVDLKEFIAVRNR